MRDARHIDTSIGLRRDERDELRRFLLVVNDDGADGNVQLATILLSAMARIREDSTDPVGTARHWIAEELSRRILLVLA